MPPPMMKPPTAKPAPLLKPSTTPSSPAAKRVTKTFSVTPWASANEGEKIVIYAKSGTGKTTLASLAPNAVFIGLDDGARKIVHPITGQPIKAVQGINGFDDMRDALHQSNLFDEKATIVIDTVTKLESMVEPYIFANYTQGGKKVTSMRGYGWDGPAHLLDVGRLFLSDLEPHVRAGRNVVLLAQLGQVSVANAAGVDYLEDGPKLQHSKQYSLRGEMCEWADHVLRIGYVDFAVAKDSDKAKVGKVQSEDATRAIYSGGAQHFIAKSRPINGHPLPPVISFASATDDSLWKYISGEAVYTPEAV